MRKMDFALKKLFTSPFFFIKNVLIVDIHIYDDVIQTKSTHLCICGIENM